MIFTSLPNISNSGQNAIAGELREANSTLAIAIPYPTTLPTFPLVDAAEAYEKILTRRGNVPQARTGLAKCYFYEGRYHDSMHQFKLAGPAWKQDAARAAEFAKLADSLQNRLKGDRVIQVAKVPGTNRILAITGRPSEEDLYRVRMYKNLQVILAQSDNLRILAKRRIDRVRIPQLDRPDDLESCPNICVMKPLPRRTPSSP